MRLFHHRLAALVLVVAAVASACGDEPATTEEFCDLSRQSDLASARLVTLEPGTAEFDEQLSVVRDLNQQLFDNPPADIASVAEELAPMLTQTDADNDTVNQLLDQVAAYVFQNCGG